MHDDEMIRLIAASCIKFNRKRKMALHKCTEWKSLLNAPGSCLGSSLASNSDESLNPSRIMDHVCYL